MKWWCWSFLYFIVVRCHFFSHHMQRHNTPHSIRNENTHSVPKKSQLIAFKRINHWTKKLSMARYSLYFGKKFGSTLTVPLFKRQTTLRNIFWFFLFYIFFHSNVISMHLFVYCPSMLDYVCNFCVFSISICMHQGTFPLQFNIERSIERYHSIYCLQIKKNIYY